MPYQIALNQEKLKFAQLTTQMKLTGETFDDDGYDIAIRRAVLDLTARTLKPRSAVNGKLVDKLADQTDTNSFFHKIKNYFNAPARSEEDFDIWHHEMCNEILHVIREYYTNGDGSLVNYGKAQKIVNITLKSCYCLDGANQKEEHFKHCHMALDSFTLAWYNRNTDETIHTNWSNLTEDEYKSIVRGIRTMQDPVFSTLTPLQKEFLIWPLEIMIITVKSVNDCFGGFVDGVHVDAYCNQYNKQNDLMMANIILGRQTPDVLDDNFVQWLKASAKKTKQKKSHSASEILRRYGYEED